MPQNPNRPPLLPFPLSDDELRLAERALAKRVLEATEGDVVPFSTLTAAFLSFDENLLAHTQLEIGEALQHSRQQVEEIPVAIQNARTDYTQKSLASDAALLPQLRDEVAERLRTLDEELKATERQLPILTTQHTLVDNGLDSVRRRISSEHRLAGQGVNPPLSEPTVRFLRDFAQFLIGTEPVSVSRTTQSFDVAAREAIVAQRSRTFPALSQKSVPDVVIERRRRSTEAAAEPENHLNTTQILANLGIALPENMLPAHLTRAAKYYLVHTLERVPNAREVEELLGMMKNGTVTHEEVASSKPLSKLLTHLRSTQPISVGTELIREAVEQVVTEPVPSERQRALRAEAGRISPPRESSPPILLSLPALSTALEVDAHGVMRRRTLADIGKELPGIKIPDFKKSGPKGTGPKLLLKGTTRVQERMAHEIIELGTAADTLDAKTIADLLDNPRVAIDETARARLLNFSDLSIEDLDNILIQFGRPSNQWTKQHPERLTSFKARLQTRRK